ncbi:MAG: hypothetical protein RR415_13915 [Ruthenibacterium sp.]
MNIVSDQSVEWLSELAGAVRTKVARSVVADMKRMTEPLTLSGDDSPLTSVWEEYCAQVQDEQSPFFDMYEDIVRDSTTAHLDALSREELVALWLKSDGGIDWLYDDDAREANNEAGRTLRLGAPIAQDEVVDVIFSAVWQRAADYESHTLYAYLHNLCVDEFDDDDFAGEEEDEADTEDDEEGSRFEGSGHSPSETPERSTGDEPVGQTEVVASAQAGDLASWDALRDELLNDAFRTRVPPPISRDDQLPLDFTPEAKP